MSRRDVLEPASRAQVQKALEALRAVQLATIAQVEALLALVAEPLFEDGPKCPFCGEDDEEKLEPTPDLKERPYRVTCLACGKSFDRPPAEADEGLLEVSGG
jgi:hypothetical protein